MTINNTNTCCPQRGQGLVEYALIIALVVLAAALVLGFIGLATNRIYGLVGGAVGATRMGSGVLQFQSTQLPWCGQYKVPGNPPTYVTMLYAQFNSTIPASDITISTEQGFNVPFNQDQSYSTNNQYNIQPILLQGSTIATGWDDSLCPHTLVVQSSKAYGGDTIFAPVVIHDWSTS